MSKERYKIWFDLDIIARRTQKELKDNYSSCNPDAGYNGSCEQYSVDTAIDKAYTAFMELCIFTQYDK